MGWEPTVPNTTLHAILRSMSNAQTPKPPDLASNPDYVCIPRNLRTHILRRLGPKTILYKAFGLF